MIESENKVDNRKYKDFDWGTVGLDFGNWEEEKIWALDLPAEEINIEELLWHFDVPFWTDDSSERWNVTPWDVINNESNTSLEKDRTENSDLSHPIDVIENHGKLLVLDGLHRLVKAYLLGDKTVRIRIVPRERLPEIASEHPIELPSH